MSREHHTENHALSLNKEALEYAKELINKGKVNYEEHNWAGNKPNPATEDMYLSDHSVEDYGHWFLGINEETEASSKEHFEFPIGNFNVVYKSGLIAVKQRAAQYKHNEIEQAAAELLDMLNKTAIKARA